MHLWQFTWTGRDVKYRLVQVAAPTSVEACRVIRQRLGLDVVLGLKTLNRVICDKCGEDAARVMPAILSAKGPDGREIET